MPPMKRGRKTVVLTFERLAMLLQSLQEPVRTLATTVALTEIRIGEVLALRWANVDIEKYVVPAGEAVYMGYSSTPKQRAAFAICNSVRLSESLF